MTTCIPIAGGVPGMPEPPTWPELAVITGDAPWPRGAPSQSDPAGLDDPRWRTATTIGFPDLIGGTEEAVFRAAYRDSGADRSLYLSWWIKVDVGDASDDRLWVGFERSGDDPLVLEITPFLSGGLIAAGNIAADITPWTVAAGAPVDAAGRVPLSNWAGATPTWLNQNTHVWLASSDVWAVQMRVPVGTGGAASEVDLATDFGMWFEMRVDMGVPVIVPHRFPYGVPAKDVDFATGTHEVPDPTSWEQFHFSTGAADPACPTTGFVTISALDVGTTNSPASRIRYDDPATTPPANNTFVNTFQARPLNLSGSIIPASQAFPAAPVLEAEFRIADWGSQIGVGGTWQQIVATGTTQNPARNTGSIADGFQAAAGNITMDWKLSDTDINKFPPAGSSTTHQCILVTLSGAGLTFAPAAVYRNMDFETASVFVRSARISNVGLGQSPVPGQPRDTFIVIQRRNMPAALERPPQKRPQLGNEADGLERNRNVDDALVEAAKAFSTELATAEALKPTIRYHVYHDTGDRVMDTDGVEDRILSAGVPFGFFVEHEGPMNGWADTIEGAEKLTDKLYRLAVPEEGSVDITTTIEALERGCGAWIALLWDRLRHLFGQS